MEQTFFDFEPKRTPHLPPSSPERSPGNTPESPVVPKDFDREAYLRERRESIDKLIEQKVERLAADLDAGKSDTLVAYLKTMSRFHRYSFNNQILIAIQAPDATHVAGFHAWKQFDRMVKKGEKGIAILAPITKVVGTTEELSADGTMSTKPLRAIVNTKVVHVFDVSQTDGKPLPEFATVKGDVGEHLKKLDGFYQKHGVELTFVPFLVGGALGVSRGKKVEVVESLSDAQKFQTGVHEIAHELLHKDETRRAETTKTIRETEAEAVAFVVCSAVGLDCGTASSDYLHLYGGDREVLQRSLLAIRSVAAEILEHLGVASGEMVKRK